MSFICPEIRDYLRLASKQRHERTGSWLGVRYRIAIVLPDSTVEVGGMLAYIESVLQWVASLRWSDRRIRMIDLELLCTPFPKLWNWRTQRTLGRCEVNSGETEFRPTGERLIRIWRREDWSKVVIHELLHAFMWDRLVQRSGRLRGSQEEGSDAEALVESVSVILHSLLLGGPSGAAAVLNEERRWMLAQAKALTMRPWSAQQTHVRGYYLLKAALLAVPETYAEFARWICAPPPSTDRDLAARWPALADKAHVRLQNMLAHYTSSVVIDDTAGRMSMRMVNNQLSLTPLTLRSAGKGHKKKTKATATARRSFLR